MKSSYQQEYRRITASSLTEVLEDHKDLHSTREEQILEELQEISETENGLSLGRR